MRSYRPEPDLWLGGILGHEAYRLTPVPTGDMDVENLPSRDAPARKVFIYAKTEVTAPDESRFLEANGFRLTDTNLTFARRRIEPEPSMETRVRLAVPSDEEAVVALARGSFTLDRFHLDPEVPKATADRLKGEWVRNYFKGERGAAMAVAESGTGKGIAGFLLFLLAGNALVIDLVAVSPDHRNQGLAGAMTRFGERCFPKAETLRVGTQIGNAGAIRCYQNLGFRLEHSHYVFHYHGPMPAFARAVGTGKAAS
ncbi:MAG: hypothetical protein JWP91_1959 [Fibrobacteres bacterium]|nr:hypothetical protein [Fibrobacterota bacterium]